MRSFCALSAKERIRSTVPVPKCQVMYVWPDGCESKAVRVNLATCLASRCGYFGPWDRNPGTHSIDCRPQSLSGCGGERKILVLTGIDILPSIS